MADAPNWVDREVMDGSPTLSNGQVERLMKMVAVLRDSHINVSQIYEIKLAVLDARYEDAKALFDEFTEDERQALWVAPTYGGIFTTHERKALRNEL